MNITQLSEHLKDVPQNTLIGYAQNPNSVVPQFLALAEIQRRQQLGSQAQPPQSTVANDVLAQAQPPMPQQMPPQGVVSMQQPQQAPQQMAQQLPENQPGVAQLPSGMPQGMAAGGIVAFADGGMTEEEDDREMAQLFPTDRLAGITEMLSSIPGKAREFMGNLPKSYEETKLKQATMEPNTKGNHKYEQAVLEEAKRQGVDPKLALHVLYKETGNLSNPEAAKSKAGALGVMQLMPKTAAGLGVDPTDPDQNIRGGISYLKQMYAKYNDPKLAAAAYNAGPGNLDKALRRQGGLDTLPRETRNYIAGLAKGGDVRKFAEGGIDTIGAELDALRSGTSTLEQAATAGGSRKPAAQEIIDSYSNAKALRDAKEKEYMDLLSAAGVDKPAFMPQYSMQSKRPTPNPVVQAQSVRSIPVETSAVAPAVAPAVSPAAPMRNDNLGGNTPSMETVVPPSVSPTSVPTYGNTPPQSKADLYAEALLKDIEDQAAKAAKDGDMNLYLSLMQAGLGMMASKSPYALGGIGEGGQAGVSTYAALQKQSADKAKDLTAARLGLYKYGAAQEGAAETREANRLYREGETYRKTNEAADRAEDRAFLRYGTRSQQIEEAVRKPYLANPLYTMNPEKFAAEIQAKIAAAKIADPLLNSLGPRAGVGAPVQLPAASGLPPTVTKDGKTYVLQPNGKYIEK